MNPDSVHFENPLLGQSGDSFLRRVHQKALSESPYWEGWTASKKLSFEQVRIENTNLCSYHCFFCPREQLSRRRGIMNLDDFQLVLDRVGHHKGRVDLHGFGEPLLDPWLLEKIRMVMENWPDADPCIYTTLGVILAPKMIDELILSGLSLIEVSMYGVDRESYRASHNVDTFELAHNNLIRLLKARDANGVDVKVAVRAFPEHGHIHQPLVDKEIVDKYHAWLQSIGVDVIRSRSLHNYGVGRNYNNIKRAFTCSVVWGFRSRVLQVTWDLKVIPCCFDFNAEMCLGDLRAQTLHEIFDGPIAHAFRKAHMTQQLASWPVCIACEGCKKP